MCLSHMGVLWSGSLEWERDGSDWQTRQVSDEFNRRASRTGGGVKPAPRE